MFTLRCRQHRISLKLNRNFSQTHYSPNEHSKISVYGIGSSQHIKIALFPNKVRPIILDDTISSISCSESHIIYTTSSGDVYSTGTDYYGELGIGGPEVTNFKEYVYDDGRNYKSCYWRTIDDYIFRNPQKIRYFAQKNIKIDKILISKGKSAFIDTNGNLYACGDNTRGGGHELGLGPEYKNKCRVSTPALIDTFPWTNTQIIDGALDFHSNFITSDYRVLYCHRKYAFDQVIDPENCWKEYESFKSNPDIRIVSIKCGSYHKLYLDDLGRVYCNETHSACSGLGEELNKHFQNSRVSNRYPYDYEPFLIPYFVDNNIKIKKIECGHRHCLTLDVNGNVYGWGYNGSGELGIDKKIEYYEPMLIPFFENKQCIDIICGMYNSAVITNNNDIWLFGSNMYNECFVDDYSEDSDTDLWIPRKMKDFDKEIIDVKLSRQYTLIVCRD